MRDLNRAGTLPQPHENVELSVVRFCSGFWVEYTASSRADLIAAGLLDAYMLEKIATQKRGARKDAAGFRFMLWERGGKCRLRRTPKTDAEALDLLGVRELYPSGIPPYSRDNEARAEPSTQGLTMKQRPIGRFRRLVEWASCENVIWPNWHRVSAEAYLATKA